jgi:hypothetical protein
MGLSYQDGLAWPAADTVFDRALRRPPNRAVATRAKIPVAGCGAGPLARAGYDVHTTAQGKRDARSFSFREEVGVGVARKAP